MVINGVLSSTSSLTPISRSQYHEGPHSANEKVTNDQIDRPVNLANLPRTLFSLPNSLLFRASTFPCLGFIDPRPGMDSAPRAVELLWKEGEGRKEVRFTVPAFYFAPLLCNGELLKHAGEAIPTQRATNKQRNINDILLRSPPCWRVAQADTRPEKQRVGGSKTLKTTESLQLRLV
ncbi:hypothetical protein E2C01_062345 [Portunus trituberculatus]|uniref:Uncharacterized protein n=1 Tax=Portunus trituberculatus TaxID=210409 RepID=A0A5B7HH22_PORTR|nr:hypothetical protein [Portunus trituberculatus]